MKIWRAIVIGWSGLWPRTKVSASMWRLACGICVCFGLATPASAQAPIVIGPTSTVQWDLAAAPATAQACTFALSVDNGNPSNLGNVTCASGPTATLLATCKVLASTIVPLGSHSLTMTSTCGGTTSLPSAPFAYLTIVVPVPQGLRLVP